MQSILDAASVSAPPRLKSPRTITGSRTSPALWPRVTAQGCGLQTQRTVETLPGALRHAAATPAARSCSSASPPFPISAGRAFLASCHAARGTAVRATGGAGPQPPAARGNRRPRALYLLPPAKACPHPSTAPCPFHSLLAGLLSLLNGVVTPCTHWSICNSVSNAVPALPLNRCSAGHSSSL